MASHPTEFVAILVFEDDDGWRTVVPRVYSASHPEIAYQCALTNGCEERYGKRFVGLADLRVKTEEVPPIAETRQGNASELVIPKDDLPAFRDPRWAAAPHDPDELANALREPPSLVDLDGLDVIDWERLSHAYGPARDVPLDLQRLASSDADVRASALWQLYGSIIHQGTLYSATAAAVPFLLRLASHPSIPNRNEIRDLLTSIAKACAVDPEKIRKAWAWRRANFGEVYSKPTEEMAKDQIENLSAVQRALRDAGDVL
jgi:hypothetical protein